MAIAKLVDGIDEFHGALDSAKEGQAKRARLVCKWHYWGEKWIAEDGSKLHLVYTYHFHEGAWAEGATRNREMIKAAQRMAHDIERICGHPQEYSADLVEEAESWIARYAVYRSSIPEGSTCYKHFYTFVYTEIYHSIRQSDFS